MVRIEPVEIIFASFRERKRGEMQLMQEIREGSKESNERWKLEKVYKHRLANSK